MQKKYIIAIVAIVLLGLAVWFIVGGGLSNTYTANNGAQAPTADPLDTVLDFYNEWLSAAQSTTTDPYAAGLATSTVLSADVQGYLASDMSAAELEPVLCQPVAVMPERVGAKLLFKQDFQAQVQVLARGLEQKSPYYAVVTLTAHEGDWQISEIACQDGESAPESEFSFDKSGYLLKSVPAPLNSEYWHLVFTENNQPGHTVPLFFNASSTCVAADGTESVCDEGALTETTRVSVQGEMTEAGASVLYLRF